ncbi:UvrD-helicase domain-containing protein [Oceanicaulis sp. MMSF_3324]|uniref:UvrD-helicase domain-containing protein n=1 Tax=Oceanicaulis sp. MMSF_3324 TaxID=3046702 RepID=UPI00273F640C|nr:UvrD-helicase domain-containing protein [Oceanicaulis sp. MMSF_3324]
MADVATILSATRGSITAPAGCGKTHLLVETVAAYDGLLPVLILTHTNAGVAALRNRFAKLGVAPSKFRLSTLDGWGLRMLHAFPMRSGIDSRHLLLKSPKYDYPAMREGVLNILRGQHLNDLLNSNYSMLIVDEYQDCSPAQHETVVLLAEQLKTVVLGDPLQAIFDFTPEGVVDWEHDVSEAFPEIGTLDRPWRWVLAGNEELGAWLLEVRRELLKGNKIDLRNSPDCVEWVQLCGDSEDRERRLRAANTRPQTKGGGSLIMAKWPQDQSRFAREIPGATKVENTDLSDLANFAESFNPAAKGAAGSLLELATTMMTGVDRSALAARIKSISDKTNRNPPSDLELAIIDFLKSPSYGKGAGILSECSRQGGTRVFRQEMLRAAIEVLNRAEMSGGKALNELFVELRDKARIRGRAIPTKAVGSTLLFKGLEAEVSIILEPEAMEHERDLYVALTRGSKKLVVCSKTPLLP